MKKPLSPALVALAIAAALLMVGGGWYALSSRPSGVYEEKPGAAAAQMDGKDHHDPASKRH